MTWNPAGAHQRAANRVGISVAEYAEHIAAGERRCCICKQWRLQKEFYRRSRYSIYLNGHCKPCKRVAVRESAARRRARQGRTPPPAPAATARQETTDV